MAHYTNERDPNVTMWEETNKPETTNWQLQALQNSATTLNLIVHEKIEQDRRKTAKRFFLSRDSVSVSPVLNYDQLNYFLQGWHTLTRLQRERKPE